MSIRVICSQCQTELEVSDAAAGKKGRCPACQGVMDIPCAGEDARATTTGGGTGETVFVHCTECGLELEVSATSAGKKGRCPHCHAVTSIPRTGRSLRGAGAADTILVTCQACQTQLRVSANSAGRTGRCPTCHALMPIPAQARPAESPVDEPEPPVHLPAGTIDESPAAAPPRSTTRYVPAVEERSKEREPEPERPAATVVAKNSIDENSLLLLPPVEQTPLAIVGEPVPEAAAAALPQETPVPPPPVIDRKKSVVAPSARPVPPQLIKPPQERAAVPSQVARARLGAAMETELESMSSLTPIVSLTTPSPAPSSPAAAAPSASPSADARAKAKAPPPVMMPPPVLLASSPGVPKPTPIQPAGAPAQEPPPNTT